MSTLISVTPQEKQTFAIDPIHSTIEFVVRHLMISKVRGRFTGFTGTIDVAPGSFVPQAIDVAIDAGSIDTREPQRDAHLKSPDFFHVENFGSLTFASKRIEGTPEDFRVIGDLTIHGVTREVELKGQFEGRGADPWGGERIGYSATATINRSHHGLHWNQALELGGVAVSDEVRIELNVEAVLQK